MNNSGALAFDRSGDVHGPGTHALIVGIDRYPYLPAYRTSGAVRSALSLYKWLLNRYNRPETPLKSCRLMLSPPVDEEDSELRDHVASCTVENFIIAANEWRDDANSDPKNVTFFYFVGQGLQWNELEHLILLEDFGNPGVPSLRGAVRVNNLYHGLAPAKYNDKIARLQLFFIDSCRTPPTREESLFASRPSPAFDEDTRAPDDRTAPVYYATISGSYAFVLTGKESIFSQALIECLNGEAVVPGRVRDDGIQVQPHVTVTSLARGLELKVKKLSASLGVRQEIALSGQVADDVIHYPDKPPSIQGTLRIEPEKALPYTRVEIRDAQGEVIFETPLPLSPHPYPFSLAAGTYSLQARIEPMQPEYSEQFGIRVVYPPEFTWTVNVSRR